MSPAAAEGEGAHSRKRSRGGDERPRERDRPRRDDKEKPELPPETDTRPPRPRRDSERDARRRSERDGDDGRRRSERADDPSRQRRRRFRDSLDMPPPDGKEPAKDEDVGRGRDVGDALQRSRSYFQHDERSSAAHGGREMIHRASERGRWSGPKEQSDDRFRDHRSTRNDPPKKDEAPQARLDDDSSWKHDGFFELEAGAPPLRKRPAFRERKLEEREPPAGGTGDVLPPHEKSRAGPEVQEDGEGHNPQQRERYGRSFAGGGNRDSRRTEGGPPRQGLPFRDRYTGMPATRGRDRFSGRRFDGRNFQQPGAVIQAEKWKHDLYEEANRSPTPKNDEDKLAKLEALLAS